MAMSGYFCVTMSARCFQDCTSLADPVHMNHVRLVLPPLEAPPAPPPLLPPQPATASAAAAATTNALPTLRDMTFIDPLPVGWRPGRRLGNVPRRGQT